MSDHSTSMQAFGRLLHLMDELREKCPWDRKQTMLTLRNLTIEETYELADAILDEDMAGVKEELGDLMLHMCFYAKIGSEQGSFTMTETLHDITEKLITRHPHIYGDLSAKNEDEVKKNWEQIKLSEGKSSVLGGVPRSLPAMVKAYRMQDKTAQVGFEWKNRSGVWDKLQEEINELEESVASGQVEAIEDELGDVLFSLINYARYVGVDPETALERSNRKFKKRFEHIESHAPKPLGDMSLEEMDQLWDQAKEME